MVAHMRVEVKRSPRRHKTVQARLVDGTLRVAIPAAMTKAEEAHWVEVMSARFQRHADTSQIDLTAKATSLASRFELPEPSAIDWSNRQNTRWGSCSVDTGRIRISDRLAGFPDWVIDYVVVHELAHLVESGHNARFWDLVNRYPLAERARGYLLAQADVGG
jgi:predicted metal-dependent hydrolase